MEDKGYYLGADSRLNEKTEADTFVSFYFREIKDLAKHFLTLVSGTLVLTVTFAEKIIPANSTTEAVLWLLGLCWLLLLISFFLCGFGLFFLFMAAEKAVGSVIYDYPESFKDLARKSAILFDFSAVAYGASLIILALVGTSRLIGL